MSGKLLSDGEIVAAINNGYLKVSGIEPSKLNLSEKSCPIQPSSLDLHVGRIYEPPKTVFDLSKTNTIKPKAILGTKIPPGHSAIIETKEKLELSERISAFGFPPAHLARSALLMTNPGHIDPGYQGTLTFTVINLGREDIQIDVGTIIVTLLIFTFEEGDVKCGYKKRSPINSMPTVEQTNTRRAETLNALSPDFGNFSSRMSEAALTAVEKQSVRLGWAKLWLPALTGSATALVIWASSLIPSLDTITSDKELKSEVSSVKTEFNSKLSALQNIVRRTTIRVDALNKKANLLEFDERLDILREELNQLKKNK